MNELAAALAGALLGAAAGWLARGARSASEADELPGAVEPETQILNFLNYDGSERGQKAIEKRKHAGGDL